MPDCHEEGRCRVRTDLRPYALARVSRNAIDAQSPLELQSGTRLLIDARDRAESAGTHWSHARRAAEAVAGSFITSPTNLNLGRGRQYRCLTELTARRFNGEKGGDERMPRIGSSLRAVTKICAQQAL